MTPERSGKLTAGALLLVLAVGCGLFFYQIGLAIDYPFTLDYGEGPLLNQARLLTGGRNIYRADLTDYPFTVGNYPPLYVGLLALTSKLFGLSFALGRGVVLAAVLSSAALIALIVRALTEDTLASATSGLVFLTLPIVVFWSPLARVDFVALAFSLAGMYAIVRRPGARWSPVVAAMLVTGAVLARQSYLLAAPLAITGWLWFRDRRKAVLFAATLVAGVLICFLALNLWTDGGFFFNVVTANANRFSIRRMASPFVALLLSVPLIVALPALDLSRVRPGRPSGATLLPALYFVGGFLSALTVGKVGSSLNYLLELAAALALYVGVVVARWRRTAEPTHARAAMFGLLALQVGWMLWFDGQILGITTQRIHLRAELAQLQRLVAEEPAPILADEHMGLLVLDGREVLLQPYEFTLLAKEAKWDPTPVVEDLRAGRFGLILISDQPPVFTARQARGRWTDEMWAVIHQVYEPVGVLGGTTLYRPRE